MPCRSDNFRLTRSEAKLSTSNRPKQNCHFVAFRLADMRNVLIPRGLFTELCHTDEHASAAWHAAADGVQPQARPGRPRFQSRCIRAVRPPRGGSRGAAPATVWRCRAVPDQRAVARLAVSLCRVPPALRGLARQAGTANGIARTPPRDHKSAPRLPATTTASAVRRPSKRR